MARGAGHCHKIAPSTLFFLATFLCFAPQQIAGSTALPGLRLRFEIRLEKAIKPRPPGLLQPQKAFKGEYFVSSHYIWLQPLHFTIFCCFFILNFILLEVCPSKLVSLFSITLRFKNSNSARFGPFLCFYNPMQFYCFHFCFRIFSSLFSILFKQSLHLYIHILPFSDFRISVSINLVCFISVNFMMIIPFPNFLFVFRCIIIISSYLLSDMLVTLFSWISRFQWG